MIVSNKRQKSNCNSPAWHADFLAMLPAIRSLVRYKFRSLPRYTREELTQEATANCFRTFWRLVELGKGDLAYPTALGRFAVKQVLAGRRITGKIGPRDVMCEHAQRRKGLCVERLSGFDPIEHQWQEMLVEDKRATPAEIATARIDFADWLQLLSKRQRKIALTLASGEKTSAAAKQFGLTAARISQLRSWLKESWERFQGEASGNDAQLATAW